jgi:hypothetical protein
MMFPFIGCSVAPEVLGMPENAMDRLTERFRHGWCALGDIPFIVSIRVPSRISPQEPLVDDARDIFLASVNLPMTGEEKDGFTLLGAATVPRTSRVEQHADTFKQLCSEAGSYLPGEVREQLVGYCGFTIQQCTSASWWVAALANAAQLTAHERGGLGPYREEHLILEPWMHSIHLLERLRSHHGNDPAVDASAKNIFKQVNDTWTVRFSGGAIRPGIKSRRGMNDIRYLLQRPGHKISIFHLPGNVTEGKPSRTTEHEGLHEAGSISTADADNGKRLLKQITALQRELKDETDLLIKQESEMTITKLLKQYNQNYDKTGQPRRLAGPAARRIDSTQKRIRRTIDTLREFDRQLAHHIENHLTIAAECMYSPDADTEWDLGEM